MASGLQNASLWQISVSFLNIVHILSCGGTLMNTIDFGFESPWHLFFSQLLVGPCIRITKVWLPPDTAVRRITSTFITMVSGIHPDGCLASCSRTRLHLGYSWLFYYILFYCFQMFGDNSSLDISFIFLGGKDDTHNITQPWLLPNTSGSAEKSCAGSDGDASCAGASICSSATLACSGIFASRGV